MAEGLWNATVHIRVSVRCQEMTYRPQKGTSTRGARLRGIPKRQNLLPLEHPPPNVVKDKFAPPQRHLSLPCRSSWGRHQRGGGRRKFRFLSRSFVYRCSADPGQRHEYSGPLGGHHRERRRLPSEVEHCASRDDSSGPHQHSRRPGGSIPLDQDSGANFSTRSRG